MIAEARRSIKVVRERIVAMLIIILIFASTACIVSINTGGIPLATYTPLPINTPTLKGTIQCKVSEVLGTNVAAGKNIVSRSGGVTYNTNSDTEDYKTTTNSNGGDWLNETNAGNGTYQVVDLEKGYRLTGIGYTIMWDGAFLNPLTFQVEVSLDGDTWVFVSRTVHRLNEGSTTNFVDLDIGICPVEARYVKYEEPPDGGWNGWGHFFQLRAYSPDDGE